MRTERGQAGQTRGRQDEEERDAQSQEPLLRLLSGNDAPLRAEQPDAVGEVPRRRDQANHIKQEKWSLKYFALHFSKRRSGELVQVDSGKPHCPGVPQDVSESDDSGPALRRVHPVAGPRIVADIRLAPIPDVEAIERVIKEGEPD